MFFNIVIELWSCLIFRVIREIWKNYSYMIKEALYNVQVLRYTNAHYFAPYKCKKIRILHVYV